MASRTIALVIGTLICMSAAPALGQQKFKYSFKTPSGISKYTQQHVLEVGDVPGHQIRIAEIHTKFANEAPEYDGVKVVETWGRLMSGNVVTITGGTGKFANLRGLLRQTGFSDLKSGTSDAHTEGEYWYEK